MIRYLIAFAAIYIAASTIVFVLTGQSYIPGVRSYAHPRDASPAPMGDRKAAPLVSLRCAVHA